MKDSGIRKPGLGTLQITVFSHMKIVLMEVT